MIGAATLSTTAIASELPVAPPQRADNAVTDEIIVAFEADAKREERASLRSGAGVSRTRGLRVRDTELVRAPRGELTAALRALSRSPKVRYAEPNGVVRAQSADTYSSLLWGLHNTGQPVDGVAGTTDADIDAPEAWTQSVGAGQTVAVVDTGAHFDHRDLQGQFATNPGESGGGRETNAVDDDGNGLVDDYRGWDFVDGDNLPGDLNGHGTHVTGTIAALRDNNLGVAGAAPSAKVTALRVLDATGSGTNAAVSDAFDLAGDQGIAIVNASLGGGYSRAVQDAIAAHPGTLYVAAAGNGGADGIGDNNDLTPSYPCALTNANVVCVGATDSSDQRAEFSNYGLLSVDLFAPGVSTASTWIDDPANGCASSCYVYSSGTSMATPHVAAALALMRSANPALTSQALKLQLLASVNPKLALTTSAVSGGRLNATSAVAAVAALLAPILDITAPQTTITSGPTGTVTSATASFAFTASEPGSIFACRLDGPGAIGSYEPCTSPKTYNSLSDGSYTLSVRAIDAAGNTDTTPAARMFTVSIPDTTAPQSTIDSGPSGTIGSASASFAFSSSEPGSLFACRLDGPNATPGSYEPCSSPKSYSNLVDGSYTLFVRATDAAGNTDTTPASQTFGVVTSDTTAPQTTIDSGPTGTISSTATSFSFFSEANASFECQLDAGGWTACSSPRTYSDLADGQRTFAVRATDAAGNTETAPATRTFTVTTPATTTVPPTSAPAAPAETTTPSNTTPAAPPATTTPSTSTETGTADTTAPSSPTGVESAAPLRAPAFTIPLRGRRIIAGATGMVVLKLTTPTAHGKGIVTLTTQTGSPGPRRRLLRLGSRRFGFSASEKPTVRVQLSSAGRRLLKRKRTIRVRATIRATGTTGLTATRTVALTLKRR